ncbi:MAG: MarC family protein [Gammaproteobacteria bacterium]
MSEFFKSTGLLLVMLNPFLLIVYLTGIVQKLDQRQFTRVLVRAGLIASTVFCGFAILGDAIFVRFMHVEFASFQIFGGVVFLLIALQFVFRGPTAIEILQGESKHLAGAVAMPVFIGPGSISACVVIGKREAETADAGLAVQDVGVGLQLEFEFMALAIEQHDLAQIRRAIAVRFQPRLQRLQALRQLDVERRTAAILIKQQP